MGTVSVGVIDGYRRNFDIPDNFEKQSTSGFLPIYVKAEYAVTNSVSIAATFAYDNFNYNLYQVYSGFNGPIKRPVVNHFRLFSGGATVYYHLGNAIRINRLDPFIGVGFTINNIRHSAFPQGDSTVVKKEHTASLYAKAGARYYVTDMFSLFGDIGYDKLSLFSVGASITIHGGSVQRPREGTESEVVKISAPKRGFFIVLTKKKNARWRAGISMGEKIRQLLLVVWRSHDIAAAYNAVHETDTCQ